MFVFFQKKKKCPLKRLHGEIALFSNKKVKYMKGGKSIWVSQRTHFKNSS